MKRYVLTLHNILSLWSLCRLLTIIWSYTTVQWRLYNLTHCGPSKIVGMWNFHLRAMHDLKASNATLNPHCSSRVLVFALSGLLRSWGPACAHLWLHCWCVEKCCHSSVWIARLTAHTWFPYTCNICCACSCPLSVVFNVDFLHGHYQGFNPAPVIGVVCILNPMPLS